MTFPKSFPEDDEYEFFIKLKQAIIKTGEMLLDDTDNPVLKKELQEYTNYILTMNKPHVFRPNSHENACVQMDKHFAVLCSLIEANGSSRSTHLTVFEFYAKIEYLRNSNTPKK